MSLNSNSIRGIFFVSNYINFSFDACFEVNSNDIWIYVNNTMIFCGISNEIANALSILYTSHSILNIIIGIDMSLIDSLNFVLIRDILELILMLIQGFYYCKFRR